MYAKYEVSYSSKVIAKVKVNNRRDKNNTPPIIRSEVIKINLLNNTVPTFRAWTVKSIRMTRILPFVAWGQVSKIQVLS